MKNRPIVKRADSIIYFKYKDTALYRSKRNSQLEYFTLDRQFEVSKMWCKSMNSLEIISHSNSFKTLSVEEAQKFIPAAFT